MSVKTDELTAAVAKLSSDVDAYVAAHDTTAAQAAVDAATSAVLAVDSKVAPPAAAPAVQGTTAG